MPVALFAMIVALFAACAPAGAAEAQLEDFLGPWVGQTIGDAEVERKATVLIEAAERGGFSLEWTSFEARGGRPDAMVRQRRLTLLPAGREGLWRGAGENDPARGEAAWAFIANRTLVVNVLTVRDDGRLERQIYYRTLTHEGMTLAYRRFLDDEIERALEFKFVRLLSRQRRE